MVLLAAAGCANDYVPPETFPDDATAGDDGGPIEAAVMAAPPPAYDSGRGVDGGIPADPRCDLNGRWLLAQRVLADAIGQKQASHNWFYYELRQDGEAVTVVRGLNCGFDVVHVTSLAADVDSSEAWPSILTHDNDTGRKGTMQATASGCAAAFDKQYTVFGATQSYYDDPSVAFPSSMPQAMGSTPGWEDWDGDGNPGITFHVTAPTMGYLYVAQRNFTQYAGNVAFDSTAFELTVTWNDAEAVLGYMGSSFITQTSDPDPDASQHYVWFVRLTPDQATGDDTATCAAIRSLVPTLAPGALN
jgi:hypothetical protein